MKDMEFIATVHEVKEIEPNIFDLYIKHSEAPYDPVPLSINENRVPISREHLTVRDLKPGDKVKILFILTQEDLKYEEGLEPYKALTIHVLWWEPVKNKMINK